MSTDLDLTASDLWRVRLGVLPVPLKNGDRNRYVMLNGVAGNFCFDVTGETSPEARGRAWSADVGHYIHLVGDNVEVYRWDSPKPQTVSKERVASRFDRFQRFLEEDEPRRDLSLVSHVIGILDRLRTVVPDGGAALNALLVLLASVDSNCDSQDVDATRYALSDRAMASARKVNRTTWRTLQQELRNPAAMPGLTLDTTIALRHCAGQLFQEAHWRTTDYAPRQAMLFDEVLPDRAQVTRHTDAAGVYFTPSPIVRTIVETALQPIDTAKVKRIHVFDPACGSGEFLAEAGRQLRLRGYGDKLLLSGYDVSERAVATARFVLRAQFPQDTIRIDVADSLDDGCQWPNDIDMLFMNPPFISWWDMNTSQRDRIRAIVGSSMRAKPDYLAAFLKRAIASNPKMIGAVLKTSCLDNNSFKEIRREWLDSYGIEFVARLGNLSLFRTATVDSALVVARQGVTTKTTMLWTDQRATSVSAGLRALRKGPSARRGDGYGVYVGNIDSENTDWSPRPLESIDLLSRNLGLPTVCDLFDVRQGIITGLNTAFILPKHEHDRLPKPEQRYFRLALLNSTLRDGRLDATHYVWYPYKNGVRRFSTEHEVRHAAETYFELYLRPRKQELMKRRGMKSRWWELIWPRLDRTGPKIVTTYYGDVGSFAFDHEDRYAVVQGYSWYPPADRQVLFESGVAYAYAALLNTRAFVVALSGHARVVGGGQLDMSERFLKETPLPDLYQGVDPHVVKRLSAFGMAITNGEAFDRATLEQLCWSVYGNG